MNQYMTNDVVGISTPMKVLVVAMTVFFVAASFMAVGKLYSAYSTPRISSEAGQ